MSDPRRASDDLFIQLIREGRHDAEIGVRLGIPTGQVRERKAALRAKLGDSEYYRLVGGGRPARRVSKTQLRLLAAFGVVAVVVGLLLVVANLLDPGEEEIAAVRTVPTATAIPTSRPPAIVTVGSERFDDAGPFLALGEASTLPFVGGPENRAALSVVSLHDKAFVFQSDFARWTVAGGGRGTLRLRAQLGARTVTLALSPGDTTTRIRTLAAGIGPVAEVSSQFDSMPPVLLVRAFDDAGQQLRTHITAEGRLSVAQQSIPSDWIIERTSGSRLEVTQSVEFGRVALGGDLGTATTFCGLPGEGLRCGVSWVRSKGWDTPAEGVLSCTGPTSMRFEANGLRLDFSRGLSILAQGNLGCPPQTLAAGSRTIPEGDWEIVASTIEGTPLSVGVGNRGTLVVGKFSGEYKCPCLAQP